MIFLQFCDVYELSKQLNNIMKLSHESDLLTRDLYYPNSLTRKHIHVLTFLCWFILLFAGTTIIGVGTSNNSLTYSFCSDS